MKSPGLKSEKEFKEKALAQGLQEKQAEDIYFYHDRARKAFEQRESQSVHLDGLGFFQDYQLNQQAANSYLRPKKNDDEVRVNTGTTEKKIEVVWNELLKMTWDIEVRAFNQKDIPLVNLGESFSSVIERTNEIEKEDDLWSSAILEGLTQRRVFLKEVWDNGTVRDKRGDGKVYNRRLAKAKKKLISGLKVFLGDETLPWYRFNEQPYIIEYDRVHWKEAEKLFRYKEDGTENPMWKWVGKGNNCAFGGIFGIRYGVLEDDEVEIMRYRSYPDDEKMDLVNGVPMDKVGTKLPWEYEGYNMRQFGLKPVAIDSALSRPLTASAKTLQSLDNETIRLMIRKFRQSLEPPKGVPAGKVFSKDIFSPGAMTQGIKKDDIFDLLDHQGVTQSEFSMFQLIERKVEEFIGAGSIQQGMATDKQQTAYEVQELQKQFATMLGNSVLMCMAMKREMGYLRLYNLLEHAKEPITKKLDPVSQKVNSVYMSFTKQNADLGEGRMGNKEIVFTDQSFDSMGSEMKALYKEEERAKIIGKDFRRFFVNITTLLEIPIQWFISVSQGFKDSNNLDKVIFKDTLSDAVAVAQIAGRPLAGDAIVQEFGQIHKKRDWFQKEAPQQLVPQMAGIEGSEQGQDLKPKNENKPSVNTLLGQ